MSDLIAYRYEVLEKLGEGALGEVLKVRDRISGVVLALKRFRPNAVSSTARDRFTREFRAMTRLDHPNIVRVYDFGVFDDSPYFTMEYLHGEDLRTYADKRRPAPDAEGFDEFVRVIAHLFGQVCEALRVVHDSRIIHRDLKPQNVWVRPSDPPRVKLLDFGHARDEQQAHITTTGTALGTAAYMAPEQALGREVTYAADVYGVGCLLFEVLAGRPPFIGSTVVSILMSHTQTPAPDPRQFEPRIPARLATLCLSMLDKHPIERPASAEGLRDLFAVYC